MLHSKHTFTPPHVKFQYLYYPIHRVLHIGLDGGGKQ